ncbi:MAG: hypothetical protein QNJ22_21490 [Desulfosarcinaceae bacterium]|nr:hypothetical protein [Desulfosarcinaceae bacterium]
MWKRRVFFIVAWGVFWLSSLAWGFDNFSSDRIDSAKWRQLEMVRAVDSDLGVLCLAARSEQPGERRRSMFHFPNPESVAAVRAEVVVRDLLLAATSAADARAEARIHGFFYSTENAPDGNTGNVWAGVGIRAAGSGLEAYWSVAEATSDDLSTFNDLASETLVAAGGILADTVYTLELVHDTDADQLRFTIYDSGGTSLAAGQYPITNRQDDAYAPFVALAAIAYNDSAYSHAEFDDVRTKTDPADPYLLYDDFSRFDATKWPNDQFARTIEAGALVSIVQSSGDRATNDLNFDRMPDYVETTITIRRDSAIDAGDQGVARINGYIYNDSVPPDEQTGHAGDVWVNMALRDNGGALDAACDVSKSLDDDETQWTGIWSRTFDAIDIQYDTPYTLSLAFTGTELIFRLTNGNRTQTHSYALPVMQPLYTAHNAFLGLRTRVYGHTSGGILKASFDDVVTVASHADSARFDATGTWLVETTPVSGSMETNTNECVLGSPETDTITIRQIGQDFTITNEDGETFSGRLSAARYPFLGTYYDAEDEADYTNNGVVVLSDSDHFSGMVYVYAERDNLYCQWRMDLKGTRTSSNVPSPNGGNGDADSGGGGGGGGCFLSRLRVD